MEKIAEHKILVAGDNFTHCCDQVHRFFDLTSLVIYDCIQVIDDQCLHGLDDSFLDELNSAEQVNRATVAKLTEELRQTGVETIHDLNRLEHGYPSKVLHVLSHMLDGFIGIDSLFYNLPADSHWLSAKARNRITNDLGHHWLLHIDCYSATPQDAGILRM